MGRITQTTRPLYVRVSNDVWEDLHTRADELGLSLSALTSNLLREAIDAMRNEKMRLTNLADRDADSDS